MYTTSLVPAIIQRRLVSRRFKTTLVRRLLVRSKFQTMGRPPEDEKLIRDALVQFFGIEDVLFMTMEELAWRMNLSDREYLTRFDFPEHAVMPLHFFLCHHGFPGIKGEPRPVVPLAA